MKATGIEAMVCEDIARRQAFGLAKYGKTVAENPLTLRQWLQHAYEEGLDQCVYLKRAMEQLDADSLQVLDFPPIVGATEAAATQDGDSK